MTIQQYILCINNNSTTFFEIYNLDILIITAPRPASRLAKPQNLKPHPPGIIHLLFRISIKRTGNVAENTDDGEDDEPAQARQKHIKILQSFLPDALARPGAVVIELRNTEVAVVAVAGPGPADDIAVHASV